MSSKFSNGGVPHFPHSHTIIVDVGRQAPNAGGASKSNHPFWMNCDIVPPAHARKVHPFGDRNTPIRIFLSHGLAASW